MITFGLTGGICCGKSTVTKTFLSHEIPVVDADLIARQVVEPGTFALKEIKYHFGADVILPDGTLNRPALSELVFSYPHLESRIIFMDILNKIMGPVIQEESSAQIRKLHSQGHTVVGYDAALICEMGNADKYRPLIVVSCPQVSQIERLMLRNGLTKQQAMDKIGAQMPVEDKVKLADYVIDTSDTIESSIEQTKIIIQKLKGELK
jgi:dephospho-CoA kinase